VCVCLCVCLCLCVYTATHGLCTKHLVPSPNERVREHAIANVCMHQMVRVKFMATGSKV